MENTLPEVAVTEPIRAVELDNSTKIDGFDKKFLEGSIAELDTLTKKYNLGGYDNKPESKRWVEGEIAKLKGIIFVQNRLEAVSNRLLPSSADSLAEIRIEGDLKELFAKVLFNNNQRNNPAYMALVWEKDPLGYLNLLSENLKFLKRIKDLKLELNELRKFQESGDITINEEDILTIEDSEIHPLVQPNSSALLKEVEGLKSELPQSPKLRGLGNGRN
jgi:hypothetical protein